MTEVLTESEKDGALASRYAKAMREWFAREATAAETGECPSLICFDDFTLTCLGLTQQILRPTTAQTTRTRVRTAIRNWLGGEL